MENAVLINGRWCNGIEISSRQSVIKSYSSLSKVQSVKSHVSPVTSEPNNVFVTEGDEPILHIAAKEKSNLSENIVFISDIIGVDRHQGGCKASTLNLKLCRCRKSKNPNILTIYYLCRAKKKTSRWCLKSLFIEYSAEQQIISLYSKLETILKQLHDAFRRPKKLFVIVNPYGGAGKGIKIWEKKAKPLLMLADIELDITLTERAGHAYDLCYNLNWKDYDGIIAVGGDGILNECVHAFAARNEEGQFNRCPIRFGLIPAGSTNCINEVATGVVDVTTTCLQIISGQSLGLDVIFLRDNISDELVRVSFCSVAYGFFGDVLIRSEKLRCMGPIRYIIAGALSFMHLRTYRIETDIGIADVPHWDILDSKLKCTLDQDKKPCAICETARSSNQPVPVKRITNIKARVAYVQVVANSCACKQSKLGISPNAHLGDGTMDVVFACKTKCKHLDAIRMLFIHNTKADRFGYDFMRPYRAAHVKIKVLPPKESKTKKNLDKVEKRSTQKSSTNYLRRKTSYVFSSSSTRLKKRQARSNAQNGGNSADGYEQQGCPPSPVLASGAAPTEHSESSRGEEEDNEAANVIIMQPSRNPNSQSLLHNNQLNNNTATSAKPDQHPISSQSNYQRPNTCCHQEESDAEAEGEAMGRTYTYISGKRFGKFKNRHDKASEREVIHTDNYHTCQSNTFETPDHSTKHNNNNKVTTTEPAPDSVTYSTSHPELVRPHSRQMWIDVENVNALWNIDGEICESNMLKLEPHCQFFSFFGARPLPVVKKAQQIGKGKSMDNKSLQSLRNAEAVVSVDKGDDYLQKRPQPNDPSLPKKSRRHQRRRYKKEIKDQQRNSRRKIRRRTKRRQKGKTSPPVLSNVDEKTKVSLLARTNYSLSNEIDNRSNFVPPNDDIID